MSRALQFGTPRTPRPGTSVAMLLDGTAIGPDQRGLGRFQARLALELAARSDIELGVVGRAAVGARGGIPVRGRTQLHREVVGIPRLLGTRPGTWVTTTDRLVAPKGTQVVLYVFEHPAYRIRLGRAGTSSVRARTSDNLTRWWFGHTLRRADHIVAASTSTARDLYFHAGVPAGKISVVPPGPVLEPTAQEGEREPAVLTFIDRDPRDNGEAVIRSFSTMDPPWRLDVVGDAPAHVRSEATELGARVVFHGRVTDQHLAHLCSRASIYLDLSLYEGFGLQAAEAHAAGLVCVVGAVTSLPEVTHFTAEYADPHRPSTVGAALRRAVGRVPSAPSGPDGAWATLTDHLVAIAGDVA